MSLLAVELLKEVLPISQDLSTTAIRQRVRQTAQRLEDELGEEQDIFIGGCQRGWDQLPDPAAPLILGIDGGYVHAKDQQSRTEGWFEVIVGKSMAEDGESSKCFGFVSRYDNKSKRRLFEMLKSQGMRLTHGALTRRRGGHRQLSSELDSLCTCAAEADPQVNRSPSQFLREFPS